MNNYNENEFVSLSRMVKNNNNLIVNYDWIDFQIYKLLAF